MSSVHAHADGDERERTPPLQHGMRRGGRAAGGWAAAQVYPKLFLNGGSMYDTTWWRWLAAIWEALVYNPLIDLGACYQARGDSS